MTDILLDEDYDLKITNGDLVTGTSDLQQQQLLLQTFKGEWKEKPTMAVGAAGFLKDADAQGLAAEIKQEFERDGMTINGIEVTTDKINVDAIY
jgi:phosphoheptose isomerase